MTTLSLPLPDATPTPGVRLLMALAALSFGMLGVCLTLPGALLPLLIERFGIRLVEAGSMLALQPLGYLLSVIAAGQLIGRLGMRAVLRAGFCTAAAGFVGFGLVSAWTGGAVMMFVSGLGFGVIEVAANTLLISAGGDRRTNLLNFAHFFFGVGSVITPLIATRAVAAGVSWAVAFVCTGVLTAGVAAAWGLLPSADAAPARERSAARLHSQLVLLLALMLGVYVGAEMGIGNWLTKYMMSIRGVSLTEAGATLSSYWLGLTAGRLGLSLLAHRVREDRLLLALTTFAAVAVAGALAAPSSRSATLCFVATGAGFSGIFPSVVALGGRYHPHNTARATSVLIAGAGIGAILIPWAMSGIADSIGLVAGMAFYAGMCGAMVLLAVAVTVSLPAGR